MSETRKISNKLQAKQRQETDDKVVAAIEEHGVMAVVQLIAELRLSKSTVEKSIVRLRRGGFVRARSEKQPVGKSGALASVFELGIDEKLFVSCEPVEFVLHRHPQDVAFFGEYRRVV